MIAKYTFLSGNIAVHVISIFHSSLQTNLKNESIQFIAIHPYNLVTATRKKSCSVRKCMVHITIRRWSVQPLHLVVLTRFLRWYYKKLHVISTRKILFKTILTMRFLVTAPRNFSQCTIRPDIKTVLPIHTSPWGTFFFLTILCGQNLFAMSTPGI